MAKALMMASLGGVTAAATSGTQYSAGALLERPASVRPCGRSDVGCRARAALKCGMGRTRTSTRSRSLLVAALPRSNDEEELDDEDDEIGVSEAERRQTLQKQKLEQLEKMQKQRPQDALKELMRQKMQQQPEQQGGAPQGSDEERVLKTLEILEEMFENEEPSEGLKQLLALVESAPVIEEPPPAPKWLQTVGPIGVIVALSFVVSYVNNELEEYYAKKKLEKLEKQARENKPRKPVKPSWVSTMIQRLEVSQRVSTLMQRLEVSLREYLDRLSRFISRFT